jgi:hypothetical protein
MNHDDDILDVEFEDVESEEDLDVPLADLVIKHKLHIGELYNELGMRDILIDKLKKRVFELKRSLNESRTTIK